MGGGLAGSIFSLELLNRGQDIVVIDDCSLSRCSQAAAGIYNPVVFKRLTKSWMAHEALPVMHDFFRQAEKMLNDKFLYPLKISRILSTSDEEILWIQKAANELEDFVEREITNHRGEVKASGFLDVAVFLKAVLKYLREKDAFINEVFAHEALNVSDEKIIYKNIRAKKIIFCEGHLARHNPFFAAVKFKPAKGEVITIYSKELDTACIINKDIFILPLKQEGYFKVGATYDWNDLTDNTTTSAKEFLLQKLKEVIQSPVKVMKQEAGVRPATHDRRPVLGFHPKHPSIGIFNGFGTKSVLLAPYFAKHLCNFIFLKEELFAEADVKRFYAKE